MESAAIVVTNDQQWAGDPRLGGMVVHIDGKRAGLALPQNKVQATVPAGSHNVRVRQWWFRSRDLTLTVSAGDVVTISARRPSGVSGFLRLALHPLSSLTLERR